MNTEIKSAWLVALAATGIVLIASPATAQTTSDVPRVLPAPADRVPVGVGQSVVIETPWPAERVSITQPDIADVQVISPQQVLLTGNTLGNTDLIIWGQDDQIWRASVVVRVDLTHLETELRAMFPDATLEMAQSQDVVVVSGQVRRLEDVQHLRSMLDAIGVKYVDRTSVAGVQQVMLQVRIAEASREAIRALGINFLHGGDSFFGASQIGSDAGGALNPIPIGPPANASAAGNVPFVFGNVASSSGLSLLGGFPGSDLQFFIQALAENQYVRVLAEPTLIAASGEDASFLAGGEFPIPVVQGGGAGGGTSISIEYKEFGVRLAFKPVVLGDGSIRLIVAPEVSELSDFGAVVIEGFQIPAVLTRRAATTLEMKSGQTFAMAGLLNSSTTARRSRVPVLGDLPIIGPLFRSVRYVKGETELLVLVTASLVEPSSDADNLPVPGDTHVEPDDWEFFAEGSIEGRRPSLAPADQGRLREMGLDRLRGPGASARYEQAPVSGRGGPAVGR